MVTFTCLSKNLPKGNIIYAQKGSEKIILHDGKDPSFYLDIKVT